MRTRSNGQIWSVQRNGDVKVRLSNQLYRRMWKWNHSDDGKANYYETIMLTTVNLFEHFIFSIFGKLIHIFTCAVTIAESKEERRKKQIIYIKCQFLFRFFRLPAKGKCPDRPLFFFINKMLLDLLLLNIFILCVHLKCQLAFLKALKALFMHTTSVLNWKRNDNFSLLFKFLLLRQNSSIRNSGKKKIKHSNIDSALFFCRCNKFQLK